MRTLALLLAAAAALIPSVAHAQHAMTGAKTTLDFNAYTGAGFTPTPTAGQLDSDEWIIFGNSDIHDPNSTSTYLSTTLGGSYTTGDLARGTSATGVSTGGMYSFTVGSGNHAFGWKPSSADLTGTHAGVFTLYLVNSSALPMVDPTVKFKDWVLNDQARSNNITFAWSTDNITYTDVPALDFTSTAAADTTPAWVATPQQVTLTGTIIAPGGSLYLRWKTNDVGGSGSRDELAIDDVVVVVPGCGDGVQQTGETCDDDNGTGGDGCSAVCLVEHGYDCGTAFPSTCTSTCGDGLLASDEECDDGGVSPGDGCSATCTIENGYDCTATEPPVCTTTCGDGIVAGTEVCDDGGVTPGDGCNANCGVEDGWTCPATGGVCSPVCGDGMVVGNEACDDGAQDPNDGCTPGCAIENGYDCTGEPSVCTTTCGDGVTAGTEGCDDGNVDGGDGCGDLCDVESGWECSGDPSTCAAICGDGLIVSDEACDDSGTSDGDGCSAACTVETGYSCTGEPSVCTADSLCGNGTLDGVEQCDDGGIAPGDGCSDTCTVEPNYVCNGEPSTCEVDSDSDGHPDTADNCPADANPSQADDDGDGIGDICDDSTTGGTADGCCSTGHDSTGGFALAALVGLALVRRRKCA